MKRIEEFLGQLMWDYATRHQGPRERGRESQAIREQRKFNLAAVHSLFAATIISAAWLGVLVASTIEVNGMFSKAYPALIGMLDWGGGWLLVGAWIWSGFQWLNAYLYDPDN